MAIESFPLPTTPQLFAHPDDYGCAPYDGVPLAGQGLNISAKYLKQARLYRDQGRYELARQSYTQALSTCRSAEDLAIIEKELGGIELLLRTMR